MIVELLIWYLVGFIFCMLIFIIDGKISIGDFMSSIICGIFGPVIFILLCIKIIEMCEHIILWKRK